MKLFGAGGFIGLAIAFAGAAVGYGMLEAQDRANRGEIIAALVTSDAAATADALVQAQEMGVLTLSFAERDRLLGVLDRDLRASVSNSDAGFSPLDGAAPDTLARSLNSPDRRTRVAAARAVAARRSDPQMTAAMVSTLEDIAPQAASGTPPSSVGVHTLIFALNEQGGASWTDDLRRRCVEVIQALQETQSIAPPTQGMAQALHDRLEAGLAGA